MNGLEIRPLTEPIFTMRPSGLTQAGEERLGDGDLADDVDLQLMAKGIERQKLQHATHHDAGIVDESGQCIAAQ